MVDLYHLYYFSSWRFCEIRLSYGLHDYSPVLGSCGPRNRIQRRKFVYYSHIGSIPLPVKLLSTNIIIVFCVSAFVCLHTSICICRVQIFVYC
jgi:hypothetical protein